MIVVSPREGGVSIIAPYTGSGPVLTSPLDCNGSEENIVDCPPTSFLSRNTRINCFIHTRDAGVDCTRKLQNMAVMLTYTTTNNKQTTRTDKQQELTNKTTTNNDKTASSS